MIKPYFIALAMAVALVLWMASGLLREPEEKVLSVSGPQSGTRMLVRANLQTAQLVQLLLTVQGHVEPNREVLIRSDVSGRIADVLVEEGEWIASGTVLVRLAIEDRRIKLDREKALLQSRQKAYTRVKSLSKDNFQSRSVLEDAYDALKVAEASVAQMELEIEKLNIRAPFAGVLDDRMVEQGGYVSAGGDIARFVDNSSLIVVVPVAQQNVQLVVMGAQADVNFATGDERQGTIKYISSRANESTRTFRVEIVVNNAQRTIPAGVSAEVNIPTQEVTGHFVSPAILSLDPNGQMGVKTVDDNNIVIFHPVSIIQADTDGVWIKGLPKTVRIITVGYGFVEPGVKVEVRQAAEETPPSTDSLDSKKEVLQKVSP